MSKQKNILTIDLNKYCTQQKYATETGIRLNTISQWIKRAKEGKTAKVDFLDIPELSITLVERKNTLK